MTYILWSIVIICSLHRDLNTWVSPTEWTQGGTPRPRNKQQERNRLEEPENFELSGKKYLSSEK